MNAQAAVRNDLMRAPFGSLTSDGGAPAPRRPAARTPFGSDPKGVRAAGRRGAGGPPSEVSDPKGARMRSFLTAACAFIALGLLVLATHPAVGAETIRIGFLGPLTG